MAFAQSGSDLESSAGHFHFVIVLLLLELRNTLVVARNDARESGYNINTSYCACPESPQGAAS